jgi:PIN domain
MFKLMNDTCVWLDVAKDPQQQVMLDALRQLVDDEQIAIITSQIGVEEFHRNKAKIGEHIARSLSGTLKRAREVVGQFGDDGDKDAALRQLHALDQRLPQLGDTIAGSVRLVEHLLAGAEVIETAESQKLRAAERALQNKAPFHHPKNSMADAIIIECFADASTGANSTGHRFAFVTHNHKDFSEPGGNHKIPHPDIANIFSPRKVRFFISLADALNAMEPGILGEYQFEDLEQHRTTDEIAEVINELVDKVWYNRHLVFAERVANGQSSVEPDIWRGACRSAKKVERKYGRRNLGPYDDFDWGMLNGKLSALRWVLGEDWDMLDT